MTIARILLLTAVGAGFAAVIARGSMESSSALAVGIAIGTALSLSRSGRGSCLASRKKAE